jgi:Fic family protein
MANPLIPNLTDISIFEPKGATADLIQQVKESIHEIDSRRPLQRTVVQRLQSDILADRVHSSAVTEGNRLSRRETLVVLTTGLVEAGTRRDTLEVRNLAEAIMQVDEALRNHDDLSPVLIRTLHESLLRDIDDVNAGKFRSEDVAISGAKFQPPSFLNIESLIREVLDCPFIEDESIEPIQKATWLHWAIARIHPFRDGNGRMSRILQDYILIRAGLVPSPLQPEDREGGYYAALEAADAGGGRALLEIVAKNTLRMADRYLSIIRDEETKQDWVAKITQAATEKVKQSAYRQFLNVQRASNNLKLEFYNLFKSLEDSMSSVVFRFRDYGSLEFEKYTRIEKFGRADRTWFFGLEFRVNETVLRYIFWFGSHHPDPLDISNEMPSKVVLLVSGEEEHEYYRLLDDLEEDRVTLREIIPNGSSFWRRRFNPVTRKQEWDTELSASNVARDFLEEVFKKLGLI